MRRRRPAAQPWQALPQIVLPRISSVSESGLQIVPEVTADVAHALNSAQLWPATQAGPQGGFIVTRMHNGFVAMTAALAFAVGAAACDNTARGARKDAAEAKADAQAASADAKANARDAASDAQKAANGAGSAIDAAKETFDVKTSLMADASVDASDINVDTFHETKTVVLKGSVPSAAQKVEAGNIAAREAKGYHIDNQLVVKPKS
jgi:osmotically-inducible protein OsmY